VTPPSEPPPEPPPGSSPEPPSEPPSASRRRFLGLLGLGAAGAAAGGVALRTLLDDGAGPPPPRSTAGTPSTTATTPPTTGAPATTTTETTAATTTTTTPGLAAPPPYEPVAGEVFVAAKLAGVRAVEALCTFGPDDPRGAVVERVLAGAAPGADRATVDAAATLLHVPGAASVARVVYPQLGGLDPHADPTTASVMVVVAQRVLDDLGEREHTRCVDVRVRRVDGTWRVERVADASGWPAARPVVVSAPAARVLDHPAIDLPDSARWDVHEGRVDDRVLTVLADLADRVPVAVTSCRRGHPINVFGTDGMSAHTVGRAVDLWAVGGEPVVRQGATGTAAHGVARAAYEGGTVTRLGSPWSFGPGSWTDPVHLDHLHLGVSA
jgi:hypothetical protein